MWNINNEEALELARKNGKGRAVRFQEKENFKMAINEYDCPHCGASFGYGYDENNKIVNTKTNHDTYETPSDVTFMNNHVENSWTEDCKCGNCGEMYSQSNGC